MNSSVRRRAPEQELLRRRSGSNILWYRAKRLYDPGSMRCLLNLVVLLSLCAVACGKPSGAKDSQRLILKKDAPYVRAIVRGDIARHKIGVLRAAVRLAPGFLVEDPDEREAQMRTALRKLTAPPKGIAELVASPMSFIAAVELNGVVLARDALDDKMKGQNFGAKFSTVRAALREDKEGYELGVFENADPKEADSVSMLLTAPARRDGRIFGAVTVGIPLWRLAQRVSRQLRLDAARKASLWAYIYKGDELYHMGTPAELDRLLPHARQRAKMLKTHPGGYTGEFQAGPLWWAYGVVPLPRIGPDVGAIILRMEPRR